MRVLVLHTHTLYAKATLPVVAELAARGHEVVVERRRDRWRSFSDDYVRDHPTSAKTVDPASLRFVAELAGVAQRWAAVEGRVEVGRPRGRFDAVLGTTKDLERVRAAAGSRYGLAVGYQHMPFLVATGGPLHGPRPQSALLERNAFTDEHGFAEILGGVEHAASGFTFLDAVAALGPPAASSGEVVILHSGGARGIETSGGESREVALARQEALLERACVPVLEAGLRPVVKIHPLRARHHDTADVEEVARALERKHGAAEGSIDVIPASAWGWPRLLAAELVAGYGSSSLYELWSAGLRNAVVCDFEGTVRSSRFRLFPSVLLDSHVQYVSLVSDRGYRSLELDPLADRVARAYHELTDGRATERAVEALEAVG